MKSQIGLLGGTFDPPHLGHLVVADQVRTELGLSEVWLVVAHHPWQKETPDSAGSPLSGSGIRLEMSRAAVADTPGLSVSSVEIELGGETTTARTLRHLHQAFPGVDFRVIVGADAAAGFETWRETDWLAEHADFVVVNRPVAHGGAWPPPSARFRCEHIDLPSIEVSSTDLRRRVAEGRSIRFLCPEAVCRVIEDRGLYR